MGSSRSGLQNQMVICNHEKNQVSKKYLVFIGKKKGEYSNFGFVGVESDF